MNEENKGLCQQQTVAQHTSTFLFKVLVSALSVIISAGVLTMFNMSHSLVRLDERFTGFDRRLLVIEKHHERRMYGIRENGPGSE